MMAGFGGGFGLLVGFGVGLAVRLGLGWLACVAISCCGLGGLVVGLVVVWLLLFIVCWYCWFDCLFGGFGFMVTVVVGWLLVSAVVAFVVGWLRCIVGVLRFGVFLVRIVLCG